MLPGSCAEPPVGDSHSDFACPQGLCRHAAPPTLCLASVRGGGVCDAGPPSFKNKVTLRSWPSFPISVKAMQHGPAHPGRHGKGWRGFGCDFVLEAGNQCHVAAVMYMKNGFRAPSSYSALVGNLWLLFLHLQRDHGHQRQYPHCCTAQAMVLECHSLPPPVRRGRMLCACCHVVVAADRYRAPKCMVTVFPMVCAVNNFTHQ